MPRQPRLEAPGLIYHIIARGIEKSDIFIDDSDRCFFIERFGQILNDSDAKCFAFIIMTNHFHLMLTTNTIPVSRVMHRLLTSYAVYFNKRHKRVGHLFQNRYKSIICEEDSYFLELLRYIHLNPVRAGIIESMDELSGYRFSGHRALLGIEKYNWYDTSDVLSYFDKNKKPASKKYINFISDGFLIGKDHRFSGGGLKRSLNFPSVYPKEKQAFDSRILGSSDFVLSLQELMETKQSLVDEITVDELIKKEAGAYGISIKQLRDDYSASINEVREKVVYLAVIVHGLSFAEVARELRVHRSTVARLVDRVKNRYTITNETDNKQ